MALQANPIQVMEAEFEKGTSLEKCRQCGCMMGALEDAKTALSTIDNQQTTEIMKKVEAWLGRMQSAAYT